MTRGSLFLFVAVALALTAPSRVGAQGSTDRQKPPDEATRNQLTANLQLGRDLEITEALLDDFSTGLQTELRLREEFLQVLAAYKPSEEYQTCSRKVADSPEWLRFLMAVKIPVGAPSEELQRIEEKLNAKLNSLVRRECGANIEEDWPVSKRHARAAEIEAAGAEFVHRGSAVVNQSRFGGGVQDGVAEIVAGRGDRNGCGRGEAEQQDAHRREKGTWDSPHVTSARGSS